MMKKKQGTVFCPHCKKHIARVKELEGVHARIIEIGEENKHLRTIVERDDISRRVLLREIEQLKEKLE